MNKLFLLFLLIPSLAFSQDVEKIKDKDSHETYYVLKSDKSIKHGKYERFSCSNDLVLEGFYKNGVRDSIWTAYNFNKEIALQYDYRNSKLLLNKQEESEKLITYKVINNSDTALSRKPILLGGITLMATTFMCNIHYPAPARENGISTKVYVSFTVDKNGNASNFHIKDPKGYGLDEESLRIVKLLPENNWLPGLINDQSVETEVTVAVTYQLR